MSTRPKTDPPPDSDGVVDVPRAAPRGRPRDPEKRERILAAAKHLFGESGPDGTSLDRIAQAAEVSKVTLYSYFESKEALFNATVTESLERTVLADAPHLDATTPRAALVHLATTLGRQIADPDMVAHQRMLVASSARSAELSLAFFKTGPDEVRAALEGFFKRANAAGTLRVPVPDIASEQFVAMVRGHDHLRALLGLTPVRGPRSRAKYLEACVDAFLKAYAA